MTFQQLRYILEVYRTGSISKAAENLFVTRPGVSLSLRNLETELGYPIFIRTQNGLLPSPQGELVLEYASRICETQELIEQISNPQKNRVEISSVSYRPVQNAFLRLLEEYRDNRDVAFSMKNSYADPFKKLAFFELDAVVSSRFESYNDMVEAKLISRKLEWRELEKIPVSIVIGKGHRLYHAEKLTPRDFEGETLLETPTMALSKCRFIQEQIHMDPSRSIVTNISAMKMEMLVRGLGFSIQKQPTQETIRQYGLRCIPLEGIFQRLIIATNPMRPLRPEVKRFIALVEEEIARQPEE